MASVALRHKLLYDPLFLDLSRRIGEGFFGRVRGVSSAAVVSSPSDFLQVFSFFLLFFGRPDKAEAFSDKAASLGRVFLLYENFGLSLDASFVPLAVPEVGVALTGSINFERSLVEFRFGTERLSAYAPSESERYRLVFPEGDGKRYRLLDEAAPNGPCIVSAERDADALAYASSILGSRFDVFQVNDR